MDRPLLVLRRRSTLWSRLKSYVYRERILKSRTIHLGKLPQEDYPSNYVCNQKYNIYTFLPLVLFEQFRFFLNMYFLVMALTQFIPSVCIGPWYTYWGPLGFVLFVTLIREALNEIGIYWRDREVNLEKYERLVLDPPLDGSEREYATEIVPAQKLRVGDIVILHKKQRVPADMILLRTNEQDLFIQTHQLDGEINGKRRIPYTDTQRLATDADLLTIHKEISVDKPNKNIHEFVGQPDLGIENTMWSGSVISSGPAFGLVIYTGIDTRTGMNSATPRSKVGKMDFQVNDFTKVLCAVSFLVSMVLVSLKGFNGPWLAYLWRFMLLFSYIIPISLRVNLEIAKWFYCFCIKWDKSIDGTVMRSTTIPEELGRVQFLLADKTGTLTKNIMEFKRLHLHSGLLAENDFEYIKSTVIQDLTKEVPLRDKIRDSPVLQALIALSLCHDVTPVYPPRGNHPDLIYYDDSDSSELREYQASSPDEVALVEWADKMGVTLHKRDLTSISLKFSATNTIVKYTILRMFPFTSENKMMGIIVQSPDGEISYFVKGADVALFPLLNTRSGDRWWVDACDRLAEQGLRTMVVAMKNLTHDQFHQFETAYTAGNNIKNLMTSLNQDLNLLGLTGVEDQLADDVSVTLECLKTAGIKVWMLTGDKVISALCIAKALKLGEGSRWFEASVCTTKSEILALLDSTKDQAINLAIEGETLMQSLYHYKEETISLLNHCRGVVVARCSPTQKAEVAQMLGEAGAHVAAVGDGGNDVAMLHHAHVGIGIEGVEGKAASLAGDVSVPYFWCIAKLLLVHGRRSMMRSAALCLFIVHRGIVVSTMQAIFSGVFYFSSVSLYPGFLMVGYGTFYTVLPVFSLVFDKDMPSKEVLNKPELYIELRKGRQLSFKQFFIWTDISILQGSVIMYGALFLFEDQLTHIVEISYSALIATELLMVSLTVVTIHWVMVMAEVISLLLFVITLLVRPAYFDPDFINNWNFWWKVAVITLVGLFPLILCKCILKIWRRCRRRNNTYSQFENEPVASTA